MLKLFIQYEVSRRYGWGEGVFGEVFFWIKNVVFYIFYGASYDAFYDYYFLIVNYKNMLQIFNFIIAYTLIMQPISDVFRLTQECFWINP